MSNLLVVFPVCTYMYTDSLVIVGKDSSVTMTNGSFSWDDDRTTLSG